MLICRSIRVAVFMHAKLLQSSLILCDPVDYSPPGSSVHGILQARTLGWVAISFSSHSHSIVFLSFFALITEEGFLTSPCYSLDLTSQQTWRPSRNTGPWPQSWAAGVRDLNYCVYWASAIQHEFVLSSFLVFISFFFFSPWCAGCGVLFPQPGIKPRPPALEAPPWKPLKCFQYIS